MADFLGEATPITESGFHDALQMTGAAPESLWAVLSVETGGCGYLADRRPKILFERHVFHRLTGGRYDADDPDVSAPTSGGYGPGGAHQHDRLQAAIHLNREAALMSASWGLGQIMGENFRSAGFGSVDEMVDGFVASEDAQLKGMAAFLAKSQLKSMLANKNWSGFARVYNGPNYAANHYDEHLALFCANYEQGIPNLAIRAAQVLLTFAGFQTGGIDGRIGPVTEAAIRSFQAQQHLPLTGQLDAATQTAMAGH